MHRTQRLNPQLKQPHFLETLISIPPFLKFFYFEHLRFWAWQCTAYAPTHSCRSLHCMLYSTLKVEFQSSIKLWYFIPNVSQTFDKCTDISSLNSLYFPPPTVFTDIPPYSALSTLSLVNSSWLAYFWYELHCCHLTSVHKLGMRFDC